MLLLRGCNCMQSLTYMCTLLSIIREAFSNAYSFSCATATEKGAHLGTLAQSSEVVQGWCKQGECRLCSTNWGSNSQSYGETYTFIHSVRSWTMPCSATCTSANTYVVNHAAHSSHLPMLRVLSTFLSPQKNSDLSKKPITFFQPMSLRLMLHVGHLNQLRCKALHM